MNHEADWQFETMPIFAINKKGMKATIELAVHYFVVLIYNVFIPHSIQSEKKKE